MSKIKLVLLVFIFFNLKPETVYAETLFEDNFNDNDASDWIVPRNNCNSNWVTSSNRYGIVISKSCVTETIPSDLIIPSNTQYSFEADMYMANSINMDRNLVFKYLDSNNWYDIHTYGNTIHIQKVVNGNVLSSDLKPNGYSSYPFVANQWYKFKIEVLGDSIKVYINGALNNTVTDIPPYFSNHSAGLQASAGGNPNSEVWFDNVVIKTLNTATEPPLPTDIPTPIPTPTSSAIPTIPSTPAPLIPIMDVLNLKQFEGGWENDLYGHTNKTISQWGCALTSASMVLNYHGHKVLPDELNEWLKSQPDGFIRNGLINWLAVSRYTKENYSTTSRTLEYKRLAADDTKLDTELINKQPAILKEDGHFIVATGKRHDDIYTINDPGYSNKELLSDYSNNYLAIDSYTPTDSDLSYMLMVTDENIKLELFDENGNIVETQNFIEQPIKDLGNPQNVSGSPLSVLLHDKPDSGKYKLKVTGIGNYNLDLYLYDIDGTVTQKSFNGKLYGNDYDIYDLTFNSSSNVKLSTEGIMEKLKNALNNNQIKNKGIYTTIKVHLEIFNNLKSEKIISLLIKQVENLTPKLINQSFSTTLQLYLSNLVK